VGPSEGGVGSRRDVISVEELEERREKVDLARRAEKKGGLLVGYTRERMKPTCRPSLSEDAGVVLAGGSGGV